MDMIASHNTSGQNKMASHIGRNEENKQKRSPFRKASFQMQLPIYTAAVLYGRIRAISFQEDSFKLLMSISFCRFRK